MPWVPDILNQYGFMVGDHTLAKGRLDYSLRGVGMAGGIELPIDAVPAESPTLAVSRPTMRKKTEMRTSRRGGKPRTTDVPEERYRINFQHRRSPPVPKRVPSISTSISTNETSYEILLPPVSSPWRVPQ